jgi:hypothetical protein
VVVLISLLAFGAGLGLRLWRDADGSEPAPVARPLGGEAPGAEIRLVRADPGTLRRPAEEDSAAAPAPPVFVPRVAPAAPAPSPTAEPSPSPSPPPDGDTDADSFDIEG